MTKNFMSVYPTGAEVSRFDGAPGGQVIAALDGRAGSEGVVFLYSGDGPVTGARGRYMYLLLDTGDCVVDTDWIDGETYDRVVPAK